MLKIIVIIQRSLKKSFDNIRNEQLKYNLLQAIPFWIGSVITGFSGDVCQNFCMGRKSSAFYFGLAFLDDLHNCPDWFCLVLVARKRICPNAKGSGIPQVMAAVELANPKEHKKIRSFKLKNYCF
jgi:hypothetical protein